MPVTRLVSYEIERVEVLDLEGNVDAALMPATVGGPASKRLYRTMVLTRQFDERMFKLQRQGRLGTFARVAGQEGAHVGAAFALRPDDWLVPAFRETGAFLLRGAPHGPAPAVLGRGRAGQRLPRRACARCRSPSRWARTCCTRSGIAWAMKHAGEEAAVLTIFGEGATSEGDFSEAMNMAGVFQVPVVFFCQNNQYAISVPYTKQTASLHGGAEGARLRHVRACRWTATTCSPSTGW